MQIYYTAVCLSNDVNTTIDIFSNTINSYTCLSKSKTVVFRLITKRFGFADVYSDDVVYSRLRKLLNQF